MRKVILASHGALSKGMKDSVQMIIGDQQCALETICLLPGESATDYADDIKKEAMKHKDDEYIVISDVIGGSVHTALMQIVGEKNIKLFSGMNMNLVLEIVTFPPDKELHASLVENFILAGKEGITYLDVLCKTEETEDF